MKYDITCRTDFLTGSFVYATVPEFEIDEEALRKLQIYTPDFLVPFNFIRKDSLLKLTYKVGSLFKLCHFCDTVSFRDYISMWRSFLNPLLNCRLYGLSATSFLLSLDKLYYDKINHSFRFIYIPSVNGCSGYAAFQEVAIDIATFITTSDNKLTEKVLRCIVDDFNPNAFLDMLIDYAYMKDVRHG